MTTMYRYAGAPYRAAQPPAQCVAVFDFDGTLFRSPDPPPPWNGSWGAPDWSLDPPCVPEVPAQEWWNETVVTAARNAIAAPDTWTVLMTGRLADTFAVRVQQLLDSVGLEFNEVLTNTAGADWTRQWKECQLLRFVREHAPTTVQLWDDRADHLDTFVPLLNEQGVRVEARHVIVEPMLATCEGP